MFGLGPMEMVIIGVLAILLFGNRLPEVARSIGKGFNEFKRGMHGVEEEVSSATRAASSSYSSSSRASARTIEDREETTAPKFEPPPAETATTEESKSVEA